MKDNFDFILDRKHTGSSKWDDLNTNFGREDLIALWKADTDFQTPPVILEALKKRLEHPNLGYAADHNLSNIPELFKYLTGFSFQTGDMLVSLGILPIIGAAIRAFSQTNDEVILDFPAYPGLKDMVLYNERNIISNPMEYDEKTGKYSLNFEQLEKKITPKTKIWLLCHPHNPTGRVFSVKELKEIERLVIQYNLVVIADEIYSFFSFPEFTYVPFASLSAESRKRTIMATSSSKIFGLAGLMYAIAIIPDQNLKEQFEKEFSAAGLLFSKRNVLGTIATSVAYSMGNQSWFNQQVSYIQKNAQFVESFMKTNLPKVIVTPPEGTFVLWLNFNTLNLDAQEINDKMIQEARIAMNAGETFGEEYKGFFRMNLGCSIHLLKEACTRLHNTFEQY